MVNEPQEHVTTTEARGGATPHMTRYVLVIGTALVVVLFLLLFTLS
jgi:hypothetical protein